MATDGMPKRAATVYLSPDQIARLNALKAAVGVPMAVVVREGVDLALARREGLVDASGGPSTWTARIEAAEQLAVAIEAFLSGECREGALRASVNLWRTAAS